MLLRLRRRSRSVFGTVDLPAGEDEFTYSPGTEVEDLFERGDDPAGIGLGAPVKGS
jgi:hypothetical protein